MTYFLFLFLFSSQIIFTVSQKNSSDPCSVQYATGVGRKGQQFCVDPYIGGNSLCCFDSRKKTCRSCAVQNSCAKAKFCEQSFLQGCSWNVSQHLFSSTFAVRRASCIFDNQNLGFWRDIRYIFRADFVDLGPSLSVTSRNDCASRCSSFPRCTAFDYDSASNGCKLKAGQVLFACDPQQTDCDSSQVGFYGSSTGFYFADTAGLYCTPKSEDCACAREYNTCMVGIGCMDDTQLRSYTEICVAKGCTALQCGLARPVCNSTSHCSADYLACSTAVSTVGAVCPCMKNLTSCLIDSGCLLDNISNSFSDPNVTVLSKDQIYDWCDKGGCTAQQCGLDQPKCNSTSQICDSFLATCHGIAEISWNSFLSHQSFQFIGSTTLIASTPRSSTGIAALANREIVDGRYYWEISVTGRCAVIGVADSSFSIPAVPGVSPHTWVGGDSLSNDVNTVSLGPFSGTTIFGVAVDATAGKIWFSKSGTWLNGGDPSSGTNSLQILNSFDSLFPVAGATCTDTPVTFSANFGGSSFQYPVPFGFLRLQTDDCECSKSYITCLRDSGCLEADVRYREMMARLPIVCGLAAQNIWDPLACNPLVPKACNSEFQRCSAAATVGCISQAGCVGQCNCLGNWYECMWSGNCSLDSNGLAEYGNICRRTGCAPEQCGQHFKPSCNVTNMRCTSAFLQCESGLPDGSMSCTCLAQLYQCTTSANCLAAESFNAHQLLCINRGCSSTDCGYPNLVEFSFCNSTKYVRCDNAYMGCLAKPLQTSLVQDPCFQRYSTFSSTFGLRGTHFCNDSVLRGQFGCSYDTLSDICFTPSSCSCVGDYYKCSTDASCVSESEKDRFFDSCDQLGCTASQCGLSYTTCNRTGSTICGGRYLECDKRIEKFSLLLDSNYFAIDPNCYSSYCLWEWQKCMFTANCTDLSNLQDVSDDFLVECQNVLGCSLVACSQALKADPPTSPDAPVGLTIFSLPDNKLAVNWSHSPLAVGWVLTNSQNMIIVYQVVISQGNKVLETTVIDFFSTNQVIFEGLSVGFLYTVSVSAQNLVRIGPVATATERLLGLPSEPLNLVVRRTGILRALATWNPPQDFGDSTQSRPLEGYIVELNVVPAIPDGLRSTAKFTVQSTTFNITSLETSIFFVAGDNVGVSVRAVNAIGGGIPSTVISVRLMGPPSPTMNPASSQLKTGIQLTWTLPYDTGFSSVDSSLIPTHTVQVDPAPFFNSSIPAASFTVQVSTLTVCINNLCSLLISKSLVEGTLYLIQIYTSNEVGSNVEISPTLTQPWRLRSTPSSPVNVSATRKPNIPLQMLLSWNSPVDTGDGTDTYANFRGYVVQVWDITSSRWLEKVVDRFTLSVVIGNNVSEVNSFSVPVRAGQVLKSKVAANNDRGNSPFSPQVSALMAGLPSSAQNPSAVEESDGIRLRWSPPADQGQGTAGISYEASFFAPVLVTSYQVVACRVTCDTEIQNIVAASSYVQAYEFFFPASILGFQQLKVYFNIFPVNDVGFGTGVCPTYCLGQVPPKGLLIGWKFTPTIKFPIISPTQMLQIAERIDTSTLAVVTDIWELSSQTTSYSSLPMTVQDFPLQTQGTVLLVPVVKGNISRNGRVVVTGVTTDGMAFASDATGIGSLTSVNFEAPAFSTGAGTGVGNLYSQAYPSKSTTIYLNYFLYPNTTLIQFSPTRGPTTGGTTINLALYEPLGFKTRSGSGLSNIFSADLASISITFATSQAVIISKTVNNFALQSNVFISLSVPAGLAGLVPITIRVAGVALALDINYLYRDAYVYKMLPVSALQSEDFVITITISDVGSLDPPFLSATMSVSGSVCAQVTIAKTQTEPVAGRTENQVIVTGVFTAKSNSFSKVLPGQGYLADVQATIIRSAGTSISVRDTSSLTLFVPHDPQLLGVSISSTGKAIVISQPALVTIQVRFLKISSNQTATVTFGSYRGIFAGCQQTPCTCPNPCSQFEGGLQDNYLSTIAVFTPVIPSIPVSPTSLDVNLIVGSYTIFIRTLQFMSLSSPSIYSLQPSEARAAGGTVVLIGLSGFCDNDVVGTLCVPSGYNVSFNGVAARTLGFVSLRNWQQQNQAYLSLISIRELAAVGAGSRVADNLAVQNLAGVVAQSDPNQLNVDNAYLVYVYAAALPISAQSIVNVAVLASDNVAKLASTTISYFPSPSGAVTGSISPNQIFLADLQKNTMNFAIKLQNFLVTYTSSELKLVFSSNDGSVTSIISSDFVILQSSTSVLTALKLVIPSCGPNAVLQCSAGKFLVTISSTILPTNSIAFSLTILDIIFNLPPSPSSAYTIGGDTMQVVWTNLNVQSIATTDVEITVISGDGSIRQGDTACSNTNQVSGTCTFVFNASSVSVDSKTSRTTIIFTVPAVPNQHGKSLTGSSSRSGLATMDMKYKVTEQITLPFSFTFISPPSGSATLQFFSPTQGTIFGGITATVQLTNFWRVTDITDLVVLFGSNTATVLPDTFVSGFSSTSFSVTVPTGDSGVANVQIYKKNFVDNLAVTQFLYIDPYKAFLKYPVGPPWPVGDSSVDNTLQVGISGLGAAVTLSDLSVRVSGISLQASETVSVSQIITSTLVGTDFTLRIPTVSGLTVSTDVNISISLRARSTIQTVVFPYTYVAPGSPYIISFSPSSYYRDGGIPLEINVANLRSLTDIVVQFSPDVSTVNASSATAVAGTKNVRVVVTIPTSSLSQTVVPILFQGTVQLLFPSSFTFEIPPNIVILSIYPLRGKIRMQNIVSLTLSNFPGVSQSRLSDVVVKFGATAAEASVKSVTRSNLALPEAAVQNIVVQITTPVFSSVDLSFVNVYHRSFEDRLAISSQPYEFYNPDMPTLVDVSSGITGPNPGFVYLKTSTSTRVVLSVSQVPQITSNFFSVVAGDIPIFVNDVQLVPVSFILGSDSTLTAIINVPAHAIAGKVQANVSFGRWDSSNFLDIPVGYGLTFTMQYFDDSVPQLVSIVPSTGSELGGDIVLFSTKNFPQMTGAVQARIPISDVQTGSVIAFADILNIVSSDSSNTLLSVRMPAFSVTSGFVVVVASVASTVSESKVTNSVSFQYNSVVPSLLSASPTSGSKRGGTTVYMVISNFPSSQLPVRAVFRLASKDNELTEGAGLITAADSANNKVTLTLTAPSSPAGSVAVVAYSAVRGLASSVQFSFVYIDDDLPGLDVPLPSQGCISTSETVVDILVKRATSSDSVAAIASGNAFVSFGSTSSRARSVTGLSDGKALISAVVPSVTLPTTVTVSVTLGSYLVPDTFQYAYKDCSVPNINDFNPKSVLNLGGTAIVLKVQNLPASLNSTTLQASFMTVPSVTGVISSVQRTATLFTFVTVVTPALQLIIGSLNINLAYSDGAGTVSTLSCTITLLSPCNFESFCMQQQAGSLVAVHSLRENPPGSGACLAEYQSQYCILPGSVPFPQVQMLNPSKGLVGTAQSVTVTLASFPALVMTSTNAFLVSSAAQVSVQVGLQKLECPITSLTFSGSSFLTQTATITFTTPTDTDIPDGLVPITLMALYGTSGTSLSQAVARGVNVSFRFIRPVTGPIAAEQGSFFPRSCIASECPGISLWVRLTNFPYYSLQAPLDPSVIVAFFGSLPMNASQIQSSTSAATEILLALPLSGLAAYAGTSVQIRIMYRPFGLLTASCGTLFGGFCADRAASLLFPTLADPSATLLESYPPKVQKGAVAAKLLVTMTVAYLPKPLALSSLEARLVSPSSPAGVGVGSLLTLVTDPALISQANPADLAPNCARTTCSSYSVVVLAPTAKPADVPDQAAVRLCHVGIQQCVQGALSFVDFIVSTIPTSVQVSPGTTASVEVDAVGFEHLSATPCSQLVACDLVAACGTCACTCARIHVECSPVTLCSPQPAIASYQNGVTFVAILKVSPPLQLGVVPMLLINDATGVSAPFSLTFLQPLPVVTPVDYPTGGNAQITVTAFWGLAVRPVTIYYQDGSVLNASTANTDVSSPSFTVVSFIPPVTASRTAGTGIITLRAQSGTGSGTVQQQVSITFFNPPAVEDMEPVQAGLDGTVPECNKCLRNADGRTTSVWVSGFPFIEAGSLSSVAVLFGGLACTGVADKSGRSCIVRSVETLTDTTGISLLYLTVTVPTAPSASPGTVTLQVEYVTTDSSFSPRIASTIFTYIRRPPVFSSAAICVVCQGTGSCIVGGQCGDGRQPLFVTDPAPNLRAPLAGGVTLVAEIVNFPAMTLDATTGLLAVPSSCVATDQCGASVDPPSVGNVVKVRTSSASLTRIEVQLLASAETSTVSASLRLKTDPNSAFERAPFTVTYYNSQLFLLISPTQGPAEGGTTVTMQVVNFLSVTTNTDLDSVMSITFGGVAASGISLTPESAASARSGSYDLIVPSSAYTCSSCSFSNGLADVQVLVQAKADSTLSTTATFRFIRAPQVSSARFNAAVTGLIISFDQATDRAGSLTALVDCGLVLQLTTGLLGRGPSCTWESSTVLSVQFGANPTVLPGNSLSLATRPGVRARAGPSSAAGSVPFPVLAPSTPTRPSPISLKGPSQIDVCSDLRLDVSVPSPRPLSYIWQCPSDSNLNALLLSSPFGTALVLPKATLVQSQYSAWLDATFTFSVYAVDFLGVQSDTVSIQVFRKSSPAPQISFFGLPSYSSQEDILLRGEASFSSCQGSTPSQLNFLWSSAASSVFNARAVDFAKLGVATNQAQLFIPKQSLSPGFSYRVALQVSMPEGGASMKSQKSFTFAVRQSPLVARVSGGASARLSATSVLTISAAGSYDPDLITGDNSTLAFAWSCSISYDSIYTQACTNVNGVALSLGSSAVMELPANSLFASTAPYVFTVTVSKPSRSPVTASKIVTILSLPVPRIAISQEPPALNSLGVPLYGPDDRIILVGSSDRDNTVYSWTITTESANATQGTVSLSIPSALAPLGTEQAGFVLLPPSAVTTGAVSAVLVAGVSYTATLRGTLPGGTAAQVGSASVQFVVNQGPQAGTCQACRYDTTDTSGNCVLVGTALIDTFRVECTSWTDENQPLKYRFGQRNSEGAADWFDFIPDSYRDLRLPSGTVTLLAQVFDSLGAGTVIMSSTVQVTPLSGSDTRKLDLGMVGGGGRRLLVSSTLESKLGTVLSLVGTYSLAGRADVVNQMSYSAGAEIDRSVGRALLGASGVSSKKQSLFSLVESVSAFSALTVGYAEETSTAVSKLASVPRYLSKSSVTAAGRVLARMTRANRGGASVSRSMASNVVAALESSACSLNGAKSSACGGSGPAAGGTNDTVEGVNMTDAEVWSWMNNSREATASVLLGMLSNTLAGEPATVINGSSGSHGAVRALLSSLSLPPVGSGDSDFDLPPTNDSESKLSVDAYRSSTVVPDGLRARFGLLSGRLNGLTLSVPVSALGNGSEPPKVRVRLPISGEYLEGRRPGLLTVACQFWDAVVGGFSSEGCTTVDAGPDFVTCECTHLTEFGAGEAAPRCGDGLKNSSESCDDGNVFGGDGCSANCAEETGWACRGGNLTSPSTCTPVCGDGLLRGSEPCDDGNLVLGDGCSSICRVEAGWNCGASASPPPASTCARDCGYFGCSGHGVCGGVPASGCLCTCICSEDYFGSNCSLYVVPEGRSAQTVAFVGDVSQPLALSLPTGEGLILPEGAVAAGGGSITISITLYRSAALPDYVAPAADTGRLIAGSVVRVLPAGLTFKVPIKLTLVASPFPVPAGRSAGIFYFNPATVLWEARDSIGPDGAANVYTMLSRLSLYGVLSYQPPPATAASGTSTAGPINIGPTAPATNASATPPPIIDRGADGGGLGIGAIVGIVIGGLAGFGLLVGGCVLASRRQRQVPTRVEPIQPLDGQLGVVSSRRPNEEEDDAAAARPLLAGDAGDEQAAGVGGAEGDEAARRR